MTDPVFAIDRHLDVVGANRLAARLSYCFTVGQNLVSCVFLDQRVRDMVDDWERVARMAAAALRDEVRRHPVDGRYVAVVGELMSLSPFFVNPWVSATDPVPSTGSVTYAHALLGTLTLRFAQLHRPADDYTLVIWRPADRPSIHALQELRNAPHTSG